MDAFPQQAPQSHLSFPQGEKPKSPHLYIGGLSPRVTEYMLQEIFAVAGPVLGVKIIPDRNFQHGGSNYGFVEYHEMRSAETALQTLNGRKIFDMEIRCNWAYQNQTPKEDLTNHFHVFVGDLSPEVNDEVLQKAFSAFGSLSDARCMWDMNSGKSRGYGFLAFRDKTDAEQAIGTMNGEWLGSRAIRVNWANQKNGGDGGGPDRVNPPPPSMASPMGGGGGGMASPMGGMQQQQQPMGMQQQQYEQPMQHQHQQPMGMQQRYGGGGGAVVYDPTGTNSTIYTGNLVPYTTQADLLPLFQPFGYIVEIRLQADRGFAFVKMDSHENASNAISHLQGTLVHGRGVKLSWGKDRDGGAAAGGVTTAGQQGYNQYPTSSYAAASPQATVGYASPQASAAAGVDPATLAQQQQAMAAWQAQYGAQYAAYMQQQAALAQQQQQR